jgi:predicted RNase H-like nuclease/5'-deoxynucleotidase YfbR-like HD superfamily hydrolase
MRRRDYITTYSGHEFSPLAPDADAIDVRDIAHALARIGRANGHFSEFYSVGQHCLDCAREALARGYGARQAFFCLLHDASEAYMSDITSPVKKHLRQYIAVEDRLLDLIYDKYIPGGIRPREQRIVKEIDNTMLYYEFLNLKGEKMSDEEPELHITPCFEFHSFWAVEKQYLDLFEELHEKAKQEVLPRSYQTVGIVHDGGVWHAAVLSDGACEFASAGTLWEICSRYKNADVLLTDLPVGLPENKEDESMRPESELRKRISGANVSAVPCRQAVHAKDDNTAREENIRVLGRTISPNQMALRSVLREIDELFVNHTEWKHVLRESRAQVLGEGRRLIISQYREYLPQNGDKHRFEDALCLAVIGQMECRNGSETIPKEPAKDARGLEMQVIVPVTR